MSKVCCTRLSKLHRADQGQALVLVAVSLMMLLMMAGLGLDVGWLHYQKQQMQKAADSAALAAAEAAIYGSDYHQAGLNDARVNGYQDGQNGIVVQVSSPPQVDPIFKGKIGYVEAIVTQTRPTFFMQVAGFGSVNVGARAVATLNASASGCIIALDRTSDTKTLVLNGGSTVNATCGVYDNSTA
jgi:uncharacterized membrane protein